MRGPALLWASASAVVLAAAAAAGTSRKLIRVMMLPVTENRFRGPSGPGTGHFFGVTALDSESADLNCAGMSGKHLLWVSVSVVVVVAMVAAASSPSRTLQVLWPVKTAESTVANFGHIWGVCERFGKSPPCSLLLLCVWLGFILRFCQVVGFWGPFGWTWKVL
jgi:hypothetical protein